MVFYFTATGNCLYVAKELDGSPISIPKVKHGAVFTDDAISIVAPGCCKKLTDDELIEILNECK